MQCWGNGWRVCEMRTKAWAVEALRSELGWCVRASGRSTASANCHLGVKTAVTEGAALVAIRSDVRPWRQSAAPFIARTLVPMPVHTRS